MRRKFNKGGKQNGRCKQGIGKEGGWKVMISKGRMRRGGLRRNVGQILRLSIYLLFFFPSTLSIFYSPTFTPLPLTPPYPPFLPNRKHQSEVVIVTPFSSSFSSIFSVNFLQPHSILLFCLPIIFHVLPLCLFLLPYFFQFTLPYD